ncbi:MAG: M67 family metallopeptidase [Rhodospirillales bacterium]
MIKTPTPLLAAIIAAAEAAHPRECCGLLVGHEESPGSFILTRVEPSPNTVEGDGKDRFLIDAKVQFDLMRELGSGPEQIIGNYHSHPGADAAPSETDRQSAFYLGHIWVIVAVPNGKAGDITAHRFDGDTKKFHPMEMVTQ